MPSHLEGFHNYRYLQDFYGLSVMPGRDRPPKSRPCVRVAARAGVNRCEAEEVRRKILEMRIVDLPR
jgi:hypothetical protein